MTSTSTPSRASDEDARAAAAPPPGDEELLNEARSRAAVRPARRDRWTTRGFVLAFAAAVAAMAATLPWDGSTSPLLVAGLVLAHALFSRVEFEIGPGSAVPTQLALVPMLLFLPAPLVPLCVAGGYVLGSLPELARRSLHPERSLVLVSSSWHAVGPAVVVALFSDGVPSLGDWPVYACALAAQFAFDFASSAGRERLAFGTAPAALVPVLAWVYAVDALLAPVGLLAALGGAHAFLLTLPLGLLLLLLARERRARLDRAITFSRAYEVASDEARRDPLTGLGNRLAWEDGLASVSDGPAAVLILDLDGLKAANDTHGHDLGDELLRTVAAVVRACVRDGDILARIGGDEFGILMPGAGEDACREAEQRIRVALAAHPGVEGLPLTVSVGAATAPHADSVFDACRRADRRMYAMKLEGGSRPAPVLR